MHDYFGGTTGQRIEELIRENRISQAALAKAVHVSKATMLSQFNTSWYNKNGFL